MLTRTVDYRKNKLSEEKISFYDHVSKKVSWLLDFRELTDGKGTFTFLKFLWGSVEAMFDLTGPILTI